MVKAVEAAVPIILLKRVGQLGYGRVTEKFFPSGDHPLRLGWWLRG